MSTAIKLTNVTKYYGRSKTPAVDDLSLAIQPGEIYGLLGANGAGKTTTIRMILDFIRPSSGQIELFGQSHRLGGSKLRRRVSYLPGDVVLPKGATGQQFLSYLSELGGQIDPHDRQSLAALFEAQLTKPMNQLSKGNRQKIGIIQAFMGQPDILILDEPTSGLDPLMQEHFYETANQAKQRGGAVLLSSHSFEEVERLCDRIGIVRAGKLVYEGPASQIIATKKPRWRITFRHTGDSMKLKNSPDVTIISVDQQSITVEPATTIEQALATLAKYPIASMTTSQHGLEDEFLHFYEEDSAQ